ncbi:phosphopantetheine-binding protein [Streptomyces sp. DT24]|uniref:phosphopantetheine-binding protein n=1 Tax=unclassified Streptomyces TaxID=2593676 RepID=UPI0023BA2112|nr:phosphopantetheine-binding protein [Streptomyces sp. AM 4-1-1]WEH34406.1 phosphopantetheine-binding protein [Streptomyces sp. AM 4-1-1]
MNDTAPGRDQVLAAIEEALEDVLGRQIGRVPEDTGLFDDLRLDSSSVLELLLLVEDSTGAAVDPETLDIDHLRTIRSFADYVEKLLTAGQVAA